MLCPSEVGETRQMSLLLPWSSLPDRLSLLAWDAQSGRGVIKLEVNEEKRKKMMAPRLLQSQV